MEGGPFNVEDKKSLAAMVKSYIAAGCKQKVSYQDLETISINLLKLIAEQVKNPFTFPLYHERCLAPYNFSQFGIDFFVPLIDKEKS